MAARKMQWNDVRCPKCKEPVAATATKCPHCQNEYSASEVTARKGEMNKSVGCGCAVMISLGLTLALCSLPESIPVQPEKSAKVDSIALYEAVMTAVEPCDVAWRAIEPAAKSGDPVNAYRVLQGVENACLPVSSKFRAIKVPTSLGKTRYERAKAAIEACDATYLSKWSAARKMKGMFEGKEGVAELAQLQQSIETIQSATLLCAGGLVGVAIESGAKASDLGIPER